jgi:hypothetical protein
VLGEEAIKLEQRGVSVRVDDGSVVGLLLASAPSVISLVLGFVGHCVSTIG